MFTRTFVAILGVLVVLTAVAVGTLAYYQLLARVVPAELSKLESAVKTLAHDAGRDVQDAALVAKLLGPTPSMRAIIAMRSDRTAGIIGGADEIEWRLRLAENMRAHLESKPAFFEMRFVAPNNEIGLIAGVTRRTGLVEAFPYGLNGDEERAIRQLRMPGRPGEVIVGPVEINSESGPSPKVAVSLWSVVETPLHEHVGVLHTIVDLGPSFEQLAANTPPETQVFVVDHAGRTLFTAGGSSAGASGFGTGARDAVDVGAVAASVQGAEVRTFGSIGKAGVAIAPLPNVPGMRLILAVPYDHFAGIGGPILRASALTIIVALAGTALLSLIIARTVLLPLRRLTSAVRSLDPVNPGNIQVDAKGEVGLLAQACDQMARGLRQRNEDLAVEARIRAAAEVTLRQQIEIGNMYLAMVNSIEDAVITCGLDGTVSSWNPGAMRLYGYAGPEVIGRSHLVLVPEALKQDAQRLHAEVHAGGRISAVETVMLGRDGKLIDVMVSISPIRAPDGRVVGVAEIARDIGPGKEAESQFRHVVEHCPSGMCMVSDQGILVMVNAAVERMFGYTREELIGRPIEVLVPEKMREGHKAMRDGYIKCPEARPMGMGRDLLARHKSGAEFPIEVGLSPITRKGVRGVLCVIVDISARVQSMKELGQYAKKLEATNADLETFAYVVSHDIKAPLRGIASVAEWIAADFADKVDADAKENLHLMLQRTHRLSKLIEGILSYSRAGRLAGNPVNVAVGELVEDIVASLDPPAHITVKIEGEMPTVWYDETQLRQVFQNLISNAITHLDKPVGVITVSGRVVPRGWQFSVADNGVGIAERHFVRIFELFQTLKPKDECKTTGAGLAIVKRIVERNGGEVGVESVEGQGATFKFTVLDAKHGSTVLAEQGAAS